jgi:MerR family transcriptional regulator/heat shock protein HspR
MQVAASLLGVHPQTLRNYERAGLIQPNRSRGNQRFYSAEDIRRLRRLMALVATYGLTMEALMLVEQLRAGLEKLAGVLDRPERGDARALIAELLELLSPPMPAGAITAEQ